MPDSADTTHSSHYVTFNPDICTGCSNCIKACPTKAIRLYNAGRRDESRKRLVIYLGTLVPW